MSKKKIQVKKSKTSVYIFVLILLVAGVLFSLYCQSNIITDKEKENIGIEIVKALYDFKDAYQLDNNMVVVKELTTVPVFNDLTIDNEQRTLTTYLKFENRAVTVDILKSTNSYVLYSLNTEKISHDRIFVFFFDVDKNGKVSWFKEVEGIEFVNTIY